MLRKQPQPVAHHDGVDPQVELVDEVAVEQPPEQVATAMDLELAPGLRLEVAHRRLDVALNDVGVLPHRVLERGRGHVLRQDVDTVRYRIAAVVVRPVRFPDLPGLASEEERVGALEPGGEEAPALIIAIGCSPTAAVEPAAAVLIGAAGALVHPVHGQLHRHRSFEIGSLMVRRSAERRLIGPERRPGPLSASCRPGAKSSGPRA